MSSICQASRRLLNAIGIVLLLWTALQVKLTAGTIQLYRSNDGGSVYTYQFVPSGFTLVRNEEIDIRFDPLLFGSLFNGVASSDFRLTLLQPNNPDGAFGDYSALSLVDNPPLTGTFSVDVTWIGPGPPLSGGLPYVIHQFDQSGRIVATLDSGTVGTPEPAGWVLSGIGAALGGLLRGLRRR